MSMDELRLAFSLEEIIKTKLLDLFMELTVHESRLSQRFSVEFAIIFTNNLRFMQK